MNVSCICVTKNRRIFLRRAIEYFERAAQFFGPHGSAELVIVDGSDEPEPIPPAGRYPIRSIHLPSPTPNPGQAHNVAVDAAKGEIIIQWDDDDWHAPHRIARQVADLDSLPAPGIALTGRFFWYALPLRRAARTRTWHAKTYYAPGCALAYHRAAWEQIPFREVDDGEDGLFLSDHERARTPSVDAQDPSFVVYMRHNVNGSPVCDATMMTFEDDTATAEARALLGADLRWYDDMAEILPILRGREMREGGVPVGVGRTPLERLWSRHMRPPR